MKRHFKFYLAGQVTSCLGDSIGRIAMSWLVYDLTGSLVALGSIALTAGISEAFVRLFGAPLLDRYNRIKVMIILDLMRFGLYLIAPLLFYLQQLEVWHLYVLVSLTGGTGALFGPAAQALLPSIVEKNQLLRANSIQSAAIQASVILGPTIAGFIVAQGNAALGLAIDACTFGVSAVSLFFLPRMDPPKIENASSSSYFHEMWDGFRFFREVPALGILAAVGGMANLGIYAVVTLLTAYVREVLKMDASAMGVLHSLWGIGFLLGSVFMGRLANQVSRPLTLFGALFVVGIVNSLLAVVTAEASWLAFVLLGLWGFAIACFNITYSYLCQVLTPDDMLGRAAVARSLVMEGANSLGSGGGAVVAESVGIRTMYLLAGLIPSTAALCGYVFQKVRGLDLRIRA